MFLNGKTVGHARNVIRHDPCKRRFIRCFCDILAPLLGQFIGVFHKERKQIIDHLRHNNPHLDHCRSAVHAGKEELADHLEICPERGRKLYHHTSRMTDIMHRHGRQFCQVAATDSDHILD